MGTLGTHGTPYLLPNGFDRADDALRSEAARCRGDERAILNRRCVDRDLRPPPGTELDGTHAITARRSTQAQRCEATMGIPYGMVQYDIGCHTKFYQASRVQLTLSAPAISTSWMSSRVRSPPPTQSGTYTPFEIVFLRSAFPFRRG